MGQNNQEYRMKNWATCSSIRSFARTAHSFTCSTLLASRTDAHEAKALVATPGNFCPATAIATAVPTLLQQKLQPQPQLFLALLTALPFLFIYLHLSSVFATIPDVTTYVATTSVSTPTPTPPFKSNQQLISTISPCF